MRKISLAWKQAKVTQDALIFLGIGSLVFMIFFVKLWDPKFLRLRVPNLLRKFLFGPKFVKMAQFICLPVTTGFFLGLLWWSQIFFGNFLLAKNGQKLNKMAHFVCYYSIFSRLGFLCFAWCILHWPSQGFGKILFCVKMPPNSPICLFVYIIILQYFFFRFGSIL